MMNKSSSNNTKRIYLSLWLCVIGVFLATLMHNSASAQAQKGHNHEMPGDPFPVGSRIYFGDSGAILARADSKTWAELGADEKPRFTFDETSRDAKSIVLKDTERPGVILTVDLTENVVKYNGAFLGSIVKMTKGKGTLQNEELVGKEERLAKYSVTLYNESDRSVSVYAAEPINESREVDPLLVPTDKLLIAPTTVAPKSSLTMINLPSGSQFKLEDPLLGFTNFKLETISVRLTYKGTGSFRPHQGRNYSNGGKPSILGQEKPPSVPKADTQPKGQATYAISYINRTQTRIPFKLYRTAMVGVYTPEDHVVAPGETRLQTLGRDRFTFQAVLKVNGRSYPVDFRKQDGTVVIDAKGVSYDGVAILPYTYAPEVPPQDLPTQPTALPTQPTANPNQPTATNQPFPKFGFWFKPAQGGLYIEAVEVGSKAQSIGLQAGQTVTAFNGVPILSEQAYRDQMMLAVAGNGRVELTVRDANGFQSQLETSVKSP